METKHNEEEELKKIAPHLFAIEKNEVFSTPENYFEKLPGQLQDKIHARSQPKSFWVSNYKLALVAASVALLIFAGTKFFTHKKQERAQLAASEIASNYDSLYLSNSDDTELADQLDDESLEKTALQISADNNITNKEIEDYLVNENIDLSTLSNEF